jgi:hypothetical protein
MTTPPFFRYDVSQYIEHNQALGVYALQAWIRKHSYSGVFNDWKPKVSCK